MLLQKFGKIAIQGIVVQKVIALFVGPSGFQGEHIRVLKPSEYLELVLGFSLELGFLKKLENALDQNAQFTYTSMISDTLEGVDLFPCFVQD